MGQMRFTIHYRDRISPDALKRIYVAGSEEIPWSTRASWEGDLLVVERSVNDSGNVYVPWRVDGQGQCILATATLVERPRPYLLEVELARGLINRIRNRLYVWELLGLETPAEFQEQLAGATREFSRAATSQQHPSEAAAAAVRAIELSLTAAEDLVQCYARQAIVARQEQTPIPALLGVSLSPQTPDVKMRRNVVDACNIVQLPVAWRAIETREGRCDWKQTDEQLAWCQKSGLKVAAGPLLRMDDAGVPDWMYLWEGDYDNLSRLVLDHVRAVVARYSGRVHLWHVASRVNNGNLLSLEEEQRLQLVAQILEVVKKLDPRTPTVVSFDQPWAEYLVDQDEDLAPMHYADALVRAGLGISGFGLELNVGYQPGGSGLRPTFEIGRLLDQWSVWGLPLMITLCAPSSAEDDKHARKGIAVDFSVGTKAGEVDPQCHWAGSVLPLLIARSTVQIVLWNQLSDDGPHEFPNGGLFDHNQQPKPTLDLMRDLRKSCLS
ncbi:MAG: endo-1,4-beta-xylanase [Planctomycetes bacterium]|nr:endo-1,4-beta-xylanase [Planctomycetota bacterium]